MFLQDGCTGAEVARVDSGLGSETKSQKTTQVGVLSYSRWQHCPRRLDEVSILSWCSVLAYATTESLIEKKLSCVYCKWLSRRLTVFFAAHHQWPSCEDCDKCLRDTDLPDGATLEDAIVCRRCEARRTERKDTIQEIVDTEVSYCKDLNIIMEVNVACVCSSESLLVSVSAESWCWGRESCSHVCM